MWMALAPFSVLLACAAPSATGAGAEGGCCELYPAATAPLEIAVGPEQPMLLDVAHRYAELTGQVLLIDERTRFDLADAVSGLQRSVTVPADRVQVFVEDLLFAGGMVLRPHSTAEPRTVQILPQGRGIRAIARLVRQTDSGHLRDHPATPVTVPVVLPHCDVRQLSTSLRALLTDNNTQNLSPAGSTDTLLITAFGRLAADFAEFLQTIDAREASALRQTDVLRLRFADPCEVVAVLASIFAPTDGSEVAARFVADERTRSVVVSSLPRDAERIRALVEQLDVEG